MRKLSNGSCLPGALHSILTHDASREKRRSYRRGTKTEMSALQPLAKAGKAEGFVGIE